MKKIYLLTAACFLSILMVACCGNANKQQKDTAHEEQACAISSPKMEVDQLLDQAHDLVGKQVEIEGICTHICKHGGRKLFLMGSSDKKVIQVLAGKEIGAFGEECVHSLISIKGIVREDRIDEEYLLDWEQRIKQHTQVKHGDQEAGCENEMKARGEAQASSVQARIDAFRKRIAEQKAKDGKTYLSFYHIDGLSYEILK